MRWNAKKRTERRRQSRFAWRKWFAWYSVEIGDDAVWLELVERRVMYYWGEDGHIPAYEYRYLS
jgi:hypothetical protein